MKGVPDALAAAEALPPTPASTPRSIDLRSLRPLDVATVLESVAKTNRLVAVEEGPSTGGWAAGLLGAVAERGARTTRRRLDRSPPPTRRSPTAPRSRTPSCPGPGRIEASLLERLQVTA